VKEETDMSTENNSNDDFVLSDMERRLTITILENSPQANSKKIKSQIEALESGYVTDYPPRPFSKERSREDLIKTQEILTMFVELKEIVGRFTVSEKAQWSEEDRENWVNYGSIRHLPTWGKDSEEPWINDYCDFLLKRDKFKSIRRDFESEEATTSTPKLEIYKNMLEKFYARSNDGDLRPEDVAFIVNPELKYEKNGRYS
jgi:hypothetical protein